MKQGDRKMKSLGGRFTLTLLGIFIIGQGLGFILFRQMSPQLLYQSILLLIVIIGGLVFFRRNVRRPLKDLSTSINEIAGGDLRASIPYIEIPELRHLTGAIDSLLNKLRDTIHKLHPIMTDTMTAMRQMKSNMDKITDSVGTESLLHEKVISILRDAEESQKNTIQDTNTISKFLKENISSLIELSSTHQRISEDTAGLSQSLGDICSTIAEMSAITKEVAKGTEELSTSTAETVASVTEITANLKEVEGGMRESARLASEVRRICSEDGVFRLTDTMDDIEKIVESGNRSLELVNRLGARSKDIEKVISVITDVVKQTNLLGTNAAILAEQAGEYGKGFSVVAGEIKTLAGKTASSAREITDIIKSIQREIAETIHVTEMSKEAVEKGKASFMRLGESFGQIIETAQKSAQMADVIKKAVEEQVKAVTQINTAMEMMQMTVEHLTKVTHEQEQGSGHIFGIAERLKDTAELIKKSMQEQNASLHVISKNLELSDDRVKHIIDTSSMYGRFNEELLLALNKIKTISHDTGRVIEEMASSFNILYQNVEALKKNMEGFRLG